MPLLNRILVFAFLGFWNCGGASVQAQETQGSPAPAQAIQVERPAGPEQLRPSADAARKAPAEASSPVGVSVKFKVLATVDGAPITRDDIKIALEDIGPRLPRRWTDRARQRYALDYLINMKLFAKKAEAQGLEKSVNFERKAAYLNDKLLADALLRNVAKSAVANLVERRDTDPDAQSVEEVHIGHIVARTEEEAKAALTRVRTGEDFAKVAADVSKGEKLAGGDLGWFARQELAPQFAKLEPGQVSEPVKTEYGWYVVKIEEKRKKDFSKDQTARSVAQRAQNALIAQLRGEAHMVRNDDDPATEEPTAQGSYADVARASNGEPAPTSARSDAVEPTETQRTGWAEPPFEDHFSQPLHRPPARNADITQTKAARAAETAAPTPQRGFIANTGDERAVAARRGQGRRALSSERDREAPNAVAMPTRAPKRQNRMLSRPESSGSIGGAKAEDSVQGPAIAASLERRCPSILQDFERIRRRSRAVV